jgi:hypothetical protein
MHKGRVLLIFYILKNLTFKYVDECLKHVLLIISQLEIQKMQLAV